MSSRLWISRALVVARHDPEFSAEDRAVGVGMDAPSTRRAAEARAPLHFVILLYLLSNASENAAVFGQHQNSFSLVPSVRVS